MTEKITGIVIGIVKHSDRLNIVTLYTRERGRVALLSATGSSKGAKLRNARLQLLSVIEADVVFRQGRELPTLRGFSNPVMWSSIYFSPPKTALLFFLAEFLMRFLRTTGGDEREWDYIFRQISLLDLLGRGVGNFHISFLVGLLEIAGISPDYAGHREGYWFDMRAGEFTPLRPLHPDRLEPAEATLAARLLRLNSKGILRLPLNRSLRSEILNKTLHYFGIHFAGTDKLSSLQILREL